MDAFQLHAILVHEKLVPDEPFVVLDSVQLMRLDNALLSLTEELTIDGAEQRDKVVELTEANRRLTHRLKEALRLLAKLERTKAVEAAQLVIPFAEAAFNDP